MLRHGSAAGLASGESEWVIVFDLRHDPGELASLNADQIRERLFRSTEEIEKDGQTRLPLKVVHLNKCPILVTPNILKTVPKERLNRFGLDGDLLRGHLAKARQLPDLSAKLAEVFREPESRETLDPELALYSGGFFLTGIVS